MDSPSLPILIGAALMAFSAIINWRTLLVPNWLSFSSIASGLLVASFFGQRYGGDVVSSVVGIGASLAFMIPMYSRFGLGAGSVKMQMGLGAWIGAGTKVEWSFYMSAASAILGSTLIYVVILLWSRKVDPQINDELPANARVYPSQLTLAIGSVIAIAGLQYLKTIL